MFERFLDRLSNSKYKDNFILKGGFLLSSIMGVNIRTTMDIDADITGMDFNEHQIRSLIMEVAAIDLDDHVTFQVDKENVIREDSEYGGFSYRITGKFYKLTISFYIDISTGDIVTPGAIEYRYKTILEDEYINLCTYNYETKIAEKFQTILARSIANSRMKDFYDLYYFVSYKKNEIDVSILSIAIHTTFTHRGTLNDLKNTQKIIRMIEENDSMKTRWDNYKSKYSYAKEVKFTDIMTAIKYIEGLK